MAINTISARITRPMLTWLFISPVRSERCGPGRRQSSIKLGDDAANPAYIITEPRVGYRMPKGEGIRG